LQQYLNHEVPEHSHPCTELNRHPQYQSATPRGYRQASEYRILHTSPSPRDSLNSLLASEVSLEHKMTSSCSIGISEDIDESISGKDHTSHDESLPAVSLSPLKGLQSPLPSISRQYAPLSWASGIPTTSSSGPNGPQHSSSPTNSASTPEMSPQFSSGMQHTFFVQHMMASASHRALLVSPVYPEGEIAYAPFSSVSWLSKSPAKRSPLTVLNRPCSQRHVHAQRPRRRFTCGEHIESALCPGQKRKMVTCAQSVRRRRCHSFCTISEACKVVNEGGKGEAKLDFQGGILCTKDEMRPQPKPRIHGVILIVDARV
jgi:hypothetical protein